MLTKKQLYRLKVTSRQLAGSYVVKWHKQAMQLIHLAWFDLISVPTGVWTRSAGGNLDELAVPVAVCPHFAEFATVCRFSGVS